MCNYLSRFVCALLVSSALGAFPASAAESRINAFSIPCTGTSQGVLYTVNGLNNSVTRLIQGGSIAISDPRGGIRFLRFQVAGHPDKTINILGKGEVSNRGDFTGFLQVMTNASGQVSLQLQAICDGGGTLTGLATVWFF